MIDYQTFCKLRHLHDVDRLSITQIAAELGLHREIVAHWILRPKYEQRRSEQPRSSKLDPFKGSISRLLERHNYTASQLLALLREEGYKGGSSILRSYVARVGLHGKSFIPMLSSFACAIPGIMATLAWVLAWITHLVTGVLGV